MDDPVGLMCLGSRVDQLNGQSALNDGRIARCVGAGNIPIFVRIEYHFIAPVPLHHCYKPIPVIPPIGVGPPLEVETAISIMQNAISGGVGFAHEKTGGRFYAHKMHLELQDHSEGGIVDRDKARIPPSRISE
ncbi:hypothetical protein D3C87_1556230 [compost metagenome]